MLGNYVQYLMENDIVSKPVKVNAIFNDYVEVTNGEVLYDLEELEMIGVIIDEELLLDLGFSLLYDDNNVKYYMHKDKLVWAQFIKSAQRYDIASTSSDSTIYNIKDLHQLQNAYFILTGEHLKVNLIENE